MLENNLTNSVIHLALSLSLSLLTHIDGHQKNSWSAAWGENGYIRLKRGAGMCKIGLLSTIAKFGK